MKTIQKIHIRISVIMALWGLYMLFYGLVILLYVMPSASVHWSFEDMVATILCQLAILAGLKTIDMFFMAFIPFDEKK